MDWYEKGQEDYGKIANGAVRVLRVNVKIFLEYGLVNHMLCKVVFNHPDQQWS